MTPRKGPLREIFLHILVSFLTLLQAFPDCPPSPQGCGIIAFSFPPKIFQ
jgi:hypothetical protein